MSQVVRRRSSILAQEFMELDFWVAQWHKHVTAAIYVVHIVICIVSFSGNAFCLYTMWWEFIKIREGFYGWACRNSLAVMVFCAIFNRILNQEGHQLWLYSTLRKIYMVWKSAKNISFTFTSEAIKYVYDATFSKSFLPILCAPASGLHTAQFNSDQITR